MSHYMYLEFPRRLADPPDPPPHGVEQRLRLLVDLLLHVVPEPPQSESDLLQPQAQRLHVPAPDGRFCWEMGCQINEKFTQPMKDTLTSLAVDFC